MIPDTCYVLRATVLRAETCDVRRAVRRATCDVRRATCRATCEDGSAATRTADPRLLQVLFEELQRHRPRFLRGLQVGATGAPLREHEAVPGTFVGMHLVALAELLHRRFGRRDRR